MMQLCSTLFLATHDPSGAGASSQQVLAGSLIALGVVLLAILISVSARSKMARRNANRLTPRERIDEIKAQHTRAMADSSPLAEEVTRLQELASMLDNKAERLEQLVAEADERIALLRALRDVDQQQRASPIPDEPVDPLSRSIYELADSGKSPVEIAQRLDEQVGKVDLILALRGRCGGTGL